MVGCYTTPLVHLVLSPIHFAISGTCPTLSNLRSRLATDHNKNITSTLELWLRRCFTLTDSLKLQTSIYYRHFKPHNFSKRFVSNKCIFTCQCATYQKNFYILLIIRTSWQEIFWTFLIIFFYFLINL